ncbi:hypothetical protein M8C21_015690 [Ambrosia artemisiifolia]|uniref:TF-B3 domain-containing protein n=1 Tax=Ambrosia artemisiifolia TaxID=4212 RepID=A0AAD5D0F7_AMBAR|nr:hypothetical protein M8C21_015690 [Ambrosia artemisiifolia]
MAPSFWVILFNPSAPHLPLPPALVSIHLENKIPEGPVILSANGGYSWRLKIKQIDDRYCFTNGWNNVVQDIQLGFGDFLWFQPLDQSTFKMSIYCPSGCEKDLEPKGEHDGTEGVEHVDIEDDENDGVENVNIEDDESDGVENVDIEDDEKNEDDDDPFFTSTITKTHTKVLRFPVKFARKAGIDAEGMVVMKNLDGEEWQLGLHMEITHGTKRYYLRTGWRDFLRGNDLSERDECVIKLVRSEGKLLLAKITKQEWSSARQPQPSSNNPVAVVVKRKRGRPRKQQPSNKIQVAAIVKRKRG